MKKKIVEVVVNVIFYPITIPAFFLCKTGELFDFLYRTYDNFIIQPIGNKVRTFLVAHDSKDK